MTPIRFVLALTCFLTVPGSALAQTPAAAPAPNMACCAASAGHGAAHGTVAVLPFTLPIDERATALAAAVLLPALEPASPAMAEMACCGQQGHPAMALAAGHASGHDASHAGMMGGCDMPCCQAPPPAAPPET